MTKMLSKYNSFDVSGFWHFLKIALHFTLLLSDTEPTARTKFFNIYINLYISDT